MRLSRKDWLALAVDRLASEGPTALKLDAICRAANLTRGSFYHHFKDHPAFLNAVVGFWAEIQTADIIARAKDAQSAEEVHTRLDELASTADFRLELGIRHLIEIHPHLRERVSQVDRQRRDFLSDLHMARFGLARAMAENLADLEYASFLGAVVLDPGIRPDRTRALSELFDELVTTRFAPTGPDPA